MTMYYSASRNAFFSSDITTVEDMPTDAVALTDEEHTQVLARQEAGYRIEADTSTGKPKAVAQGLTDATGTTEQDAINARLPLAGGTVTGTIRAGQEGFVTSTADDKAVRISGGTGYAAGASVIVYGKNHADYPGAFRMRSTDGTNTADLDALPDGSITWDGHNLVRSVNGKDADASGAVTIDLSFLPLAGGTMTGPIKTAVEGIIVGNSDTVGLRMSGGTGWNNGASLVVYGKSHASYPGVARIKTTDGTNSKELTLKPDGTATWGGKTVSTHSSGTADLEAGVSALATGQLYYVYE